MTDIVLDATVLINFCCVDKMELFKHVHRYHVSPTVEKEVCRQESVERLQRALRKFWIRQVVATPAELELAVRLMEHGLDAGEAEAAAIALSRHWVLATDDGTARRKLMSAPLTAGLCFTGTVGLLGMWVREGFLPLHEAEVLHGDMVEHGFRSPVERVADIL